MVLLTSNYLFIGWSRVGGGPIPRSQRILNAPIRVYPRGRMFWSTKQVIVSTPAYHTTLPPEEAARLYPRWVDAKIAFGEAAHALRGTRGLARLEQNGKHLPAGSLVPAIAARIQQELKGRPRGGWERAPTWDREARRYRTPRTAYRLRDIEEALNRAIQAGVVRPGERELEAGAGAGGAGAGAGAGGVAGAAYY